MTKQLVKPILVGILVGAALFVLPFFVLRVLVFFLLIGGLFRLLAGRWSRWGRYGYGRFHPAMADAIRSMSEEDYQAFRRRFEGYAHPRREETPNPKNS